MARHSAYQEHDKPPELNGDTGFVGVNMRLDPSVLPPGYVAQAINCRFNKGIVETRLGASFPVWANTVTSPGTSSGTFFFVATSVIVFLGVATASTRSGDVNTPGPIVSHGLTSGQKMTVGTTGAPLTLAGTGLTLTTPTASTISWPTSTPDGSYTVTITIAPYTTPGSAGYGWGIIYGVGVFLDPNSFKEYLIVATSNGVFYCTPNNIPYIIPLPSGITLTGPVNFTQAFDILIMHRGEDLVALQTSSVTTPWTVITQNTVGADSQLRPIPNAKRSLFFQNRLFVPFQNDEIAISDFNDYTRFLPTIQEFRINQGSADSLVAIEKFNDTTIIAFKDHSIYAILNVYGDLSATQLDEISNRFGCAAAKSIAHVGSDLWFLSELGVMSIRQTEQNKLQGVAIPVSDPIQPLIDRINWRYAAGAVASYWDNKYYLAVPLDDAEILGPELLSSSSTSWDPYYVPVEVGATYRLVMGANDFKVSDGATQYTKSIDFVAVNPYLSYERVVQPITASLRKLVAKGVNNAILVYDFLNGAWAGYDTTEGFGVGNFIVYNFNNKQRLFVQTSDGFIKLYEEDFEDQLTVPFTDLLINTAVSAGSTLSVNNGTALTVIDGITNSATQWANGDSGSGPDLPANRANIWQDLGLNAGYGPANAIVWTAPGTNSILIANGIRFYATTGIVPVVTATGTWYTIQENNMSQIISSFTTRAYTPQSIESELYSWIGLDLQTWNPKYSIDVLSNGEIEIMNQVTDRTKDRTKWYKPFDKLDFDLLNVTGHYMDKFRQDYSLLLGDSVGTGEAASVRLDTSDGIRLDLHQSVRETFKVNVIDTGLQVKLTNTRGRFRCTGALVEGSKETTKGTVVV